MAYSQNPTPLWAGSPQTLLSAAGAVSYTVRTGDDNAVIYSGRAVSRPGANSVTVDIADIAADYCRQEMPAFQADLDHDSPEALLVKFNRPFLIQSTSPAVSRTVNFCADWSYRNDAPRLRFLSDPVLAVIPGGGVAIVSDLCVPATSAALKAGATTLATIPGLTASSPYNLLFPVAMLDATSVTVTCGTRSQTFSVDACLKNALYYVNAFGGWDCLPLANIVKGQDIFTRASVALDFVPSSVDPRSRRDFFVSSERTFQVQTPWLTDAQSARFSLHVPGTVLASFFHNGAFWPVTIDDTQIAADLTASSNGRVPVRHTLTLRLAQYRFRK